MSQLLTREKAAFAGMTDREAVAYWNILQFPCITDDPDRQARHIALMSETLKARGIAHEVGKRTEVA
jgi:hypothetical protein